MLNNLGTYHQSRPGPPHSASNSFGGTPRTASPKKPVTLNLKRGRRRKNVVESSSPSSVRPQTNGQQVRPPTEPLLEIGESQHSESSDLTSEVPESDAASPPLFIPTDDFVEPSRQVEAVVQPSLPPSSYLRGEYEAVSSSPLLSSTALQPNTQPEPSQYIPDAADTSEGTNQTTDFSAVLTTPSQQTRAVPVNSGQTPGLVTDSQSLAGSSSYVVSADENTSNFDSAAPQTIDTSSGRPAQSTVEQVAQDSSEAVETSGESEVEARVSQQENIESSGERQRPDQHVQASSQPSPQRRDISQPPDDTNPGAEQLESQPFSAGPLFKDIGLVGPEIDQIQEAGNSHVTDRPSIANSPIVLQDQGTNTYKETPTIETRRSPSPATFEGILATSPTFEPTSAQVQEEADGFPSAASSAKQAQQASISEDIDSSTVSEVPEPQERQESYRGQPNEPTPLSGFASQSIRSQNDPEVAPTVAGAELVDLKSTVQEPSTSLDGFPVTPPPRNIFPANQPLALSRPPPTIDRSSFDFATQPSRPNGAHTPIPDFGAPSSLDRPVQRSQTSIDIRIARDGSAAIDGSPALCSSPFPKVPSQSVDTGLLGESAPPRPTTLSGTALSVTRTMDGSQNTPSASELLRAKLKAMREDNKRKFSSQQEVIPTSTPAPEGTAGSQSNGLVISVASIEAPVVSVSQSDPLPAIPPRLASPLLFAQDGWRSPSAVPHFEPLPPITQEEMNTAGRYETLLPQSQGYGDGRERNGSLTTAGTPSKENNAQDPETAELYTIPISMVGPQRDHYPSTVYFYRDSIQRFLEDSHPDAESVEKLRNFVERMRRITMHLDLDDPETLTQYDVDPAHLADWDVKASAKFRFLKDLFFSLRDTDLNVAIVARPGRVIDMLDTFLLGKQIPYRRLGTSAPKVIEGQGNAKAILLDTEVEVPEAETADLVIAMENLVRHDTHSMRALRRKDGTWAPFVSLVVPRTVEHLERSLSPNLSAHAVSRALVSGIFQLRNDAGRLEEGQLPPKETAIALAQYLTSTERSSWSIPSLTLLQDLDSQTESELDAASARTGEKRSREPDGVMSDHAEPNKRIRLGTQGTNAEEAEITHISDSIDKTAQSNETSTQEEVIRRQRATEKRLRGLLVDALNGRDEHKQALADLQFRHEEQRTKLFETRAERDAAITTTQNAVSRLNEQSNAMSNLRTRRTGLEEELKEAKERLLDHSVPERAEFEALRLAAAQSKTDKEKTEVRLLQVQKDLEYVRGLYQSSSNSAQELATKNTELENQVAVLQNKVTGERTALREMGYDAFTKKLRSENKKLKSMMKDRESAIKFRDEEIAKLKEARGRVMGTRGTSVPRSPRVGSPMKSDRRMGSRQTSPAAGELRERPGLLHALRNAQG